MLLNDEVVTSYVRAVNTCSSAPSAPTDGTVTFSSNNDHDSVATFACDTGFSLSGDASLTCNATSDGVAWPTASAAPTCTGHFFCVFVVVVCGVCHSCCCLVVIS